MDPMGIGGWFWGLLQKVVADQLKPHVEKYGVYVVGAVVGWLGARGWKWVMGLFYGIVAAACLQVLFFGGTSQTVTVVAQGQPTTPCEAHVREIGQVAAYLRDARLQKKVTIMMEAEMYNKPCPYVEDLKAVFATAGWGSVEIQPATTPLYGNGIVFQRAVEDSLADSLCFILALAEQEVRPRLQNPNPLDEWIFWVKNQWDEGGANTLRCKY